jgi:hypothetical protein
MAKNILPVFRTFPEEGQIIGRLVVGYGVLEFYLSCCLGPALGSDDRALRALFRVRSESTRIDVADALMRPPYKEIGLQDKYNEMLGAIRHCKTIRNHGWLMFASLDAAVKSREGGIAVPYSPINLAALKAQEEYFVYTAELLQHLWPEYEHLAGRELSSPSESSSENKRSAAS